jgi:hypothetical protein
MTSKSKRIALITGASANAGAHIVIHWGRSASDADSLFKQIQATCMPPWIQIWLHNPPLIVSCLQIAT